MKPILLLPLGLALLVRSHVEDDVTPFRLALQRAERALDGGQNDTARALIERALERDRRSTEAWRLRARWAEAAATLRPSR